MAAYSSFDSTPRKAASSVASSTTPLTSQPSSAISVKWDQFEPASTVSQNLDPFAPWPSHAMHVTGNPNMAYMYSDDVTNGALSTPPSTWHFDQSQAVDVSGYQQFVEPSEGSMEPSTWSASDCSGSPSHVPNGQPQSKAHGVKGTNTQQQHDFSGSDPYTETPRPDSKMPYRERSESHPTSVLRRDSTRRSNARIEIPENRNLATIELLIKQARNEDDLKELKAQRRLLRNREAALASRQRKKRHTEDLEVKEKGYTSQITALENQMAELRLKYASAEDEIRQYQQQQTNAYSLIEILQAEKQEMVVKHTREAGLLRQRIQYLSQNSDTMLKPTTSATTSMSAASDYSQADTLDVSPRGWDDVFFSANSYSSSNMYDNADTNERSSSTAVTTPASMPYNPKQQVQNVNSNSSHGTEQPVASGILFMLLLCGALVASKSTAYTKVPAMPDEVRAASTTVLDNLLQEPVMSRRPSKQSGCGSEAVPSPSAQVGWQPPSNSHARNDRLGSLHQQMTGMTKDQHAAQLFAMTPDEYNSFTTASDVFSAPSGQPANSNSAPRRNLAESLAHVFPEQNDRPGRDVYTRSLLWDRIPEDVVKQFKDIVQQSRYDDETMQYAYN